LIVPTVKCNERMNLGLTHDPLGKYFINQMMLDYLKKFGRFRDETVIETWHGIYPKLTNGETELIL